MKSYRYKKLYIIMMMSLLFILIQSISIELHSDEKKFVKKSDNSANELIYEELENIGDLKDKKQSQIIIDTADKKISGFIVNTTSISTHKHDEDRDEIRYHIIGILMVITALLIRLSKNKENDRKKEHKKMIENVKYHL